MASKKWFGIAAVVGAIGAATGVALNRLRQSSAMPAETNKEDKEKVAGELEPAAT